MFCVCNRSILADAVCSLSVLRRGAVGMQWAWQRFHWPFKQTNKQTQKKQQKGDEQERCIELSHTFYLVSSTFGSY